MPLTIESTSMLIGKALDIMMSDFDFDPMEDISESLAVDTEEDCVEATDNEVQEYLRLARERRTRKRGRRVEGTGFDDDSLRHIHGSERYSVCSGASSSTFLDEDDEEYEIPLNDECEADKCSKDNATAMDTESLTSLLRHQ